MSGTLTITRGLPASGKTTYAREQCAAAAVRGRTCIRANRDDLRASMFTGFYDAPPDERFAREELVSAAQRAAVRDALGRGWSVIVDDTNLRMKVARGWADLALSCGASFHVCDDFLAVSLDECLRRDEQRTPGEGRVGPEVIRGMHARYLVSGPLPPPFPTETVVGAHYMPDETLPSAVMVDIDGTVAVHAGRNPYDTSRYHEDRPNRDVVDVVQRLAWAAESSVRLVFCSGREDTYRGVTERWLSDNVRMPFSAELFMRPAGDKRNDAVVKLELFDKHIRHRYRVIGVFDDRDRVVRMWRSIGLTVFQVAEGAF